LAELEIENRSLKKSQGASETGLRDMYAGQRAEIDVIKEEIRNINGRLDEIDHELRQATKSVSDSLKNTETALNHFSQTASENQNRILRVEKFVGFEPGDEAAAKPEVSAPAGEKMSEEDLYKVSKQAYDRGDLEIARQGFTKFIEIYPKSDQADNARFWIGEIYFNEGWHQKAILEYQEVIEKYPKSNKVAGAYLKQGLAFEKLGEKANALLVLRMLIEKYPNSSEAGIARQKVSQIE
jgi:tol-pal system protein YbgF